MLRKKNEDGSTGFVKLLNDEIEQLKTKGLLLIARGNGKSSMVLDELIWSYNKMLYEKKKGNRIIAKKRDCKTSWSRRWKYDWNMGYLSSSRRVIKKK